MKLYAIRDRLLDYFMQPFAAPSEKQVLAAISSTINNGVNNDDIAKTPHHFEVWKLAEVTDDGFIVQDRQLICSCASLIRERVREGGNDGRADQNGTAARQSQKHLGVATDGGGTTKPAHAGPVETEGGTAPAVHHRPGGAGEGGEIRKPS